MAGLLWMLPEMIPQQVVPALSAAAHWLFSARDGCTPKKRKSRSSSVVAGQEVPGMNRCRVSL